MHVLRISAATYNQNGPDDNAELLRDLVRTGRPMGVLASVAGEPAGWCAVSPREDFGRIVRSPALKLDSLSRPDVWSAVCFYVRAEFRRQGVMRALLDGAIRYAEEQGAGLLEAYPAGEGLARAHCTADRCTCSPRPASSWQGRRAAAGS